MLAFCRCGHTSDEHIAGGGCIHVNGPNRKLAVGEAICSCTRYEPDDRLTSSEDFIAKVLEKVLAKENIPIEPVEREEALQVLRIALWKTSTKYDSRSHVRFRVYAYLELYNDTIDHFRSERGRHGQHRVFDARNTDVGDTADGDGAARSNRLDGAASNDPADDPDTWAADAGGLLTVGDRPPAEPAGDEGRSDAPRDARRDRRPGRSTDRRARAAAPVTGRAAARRLTRPAFVDCPACGWRNYLATPHGIPGWQTPTTCGGCGQPLDQGAAA